MIKWKSTTTHHAARLALGLSNDEYCLLDWVYHTQGNEVYGKEGWCEIPYQDIAALIGMSKGGAFQMVDRMEKRGFIEVNPANTKRKRVTAKFSLPVYFDVRQDEEVGATIVQKVNGEQSFVQKVNADRSESERNRSESERQIKVNNKETIKVNPTTATQAEIFNLKDSEISFSDPDAGIKCAKKMAEFFKTEGRDQWISMGGPVIGEFPNQIPDPAAVDSVTWDWANSERNISLVPYWRRHVGKLANWVKAYKNKQHDNINPITRNGRVQQRGADKAIPTSEELRRKYGVL